MKNEELKATHSRKQSHIDLAPAAQITVSDKRFYYEPMLAAHPLKDAEMPVTLGVKTVRFPIWISSMTGGSAKAAEINKRLAATAKKFGFGMGLGSCRIILEDSTYFSHFNLRPVLGDALPFYANMGVAQVEEMLQSKKLYLLKNLVKRLDVDGLIVHVNPLQEWLQPEGNTISVPPLETISNLLNETNIPLIVKEVGQGFGPESMKALLQFPLVAVDFAAAGGTNFSKLELLRNDRMSPYFEPVTTIGHSAEEMVGFLNDAVDELHEKRKTNMVIVSGGIRNFLDGYYLISKSKLPALYGQASAFLAEAKNSQKALDEYAQMQTEGLLLAKSFLKIK